MTSEAYTHEVVSFGFWAGDQNVPSRPTTRTRHRSRPSCAAGRSRRRQAAGSSRARGSLAVLPYEDVRTSADPKATLLDFLQSAYEAGADAAGWNRDELISSWCPTRRQAEARPDSMSRRQRLTLVAAILGSGVAMIDGTIVNVALPSIERDLGGGLSAQQWVSNAYLLVARLADPDRRLARRHLRRAARSSRSASRAFGVLLGRVRAGADDRGADRRAGAPGRGRRAADAELARDHRRRVPGRAAGGRDRHLDRLGRDRGDRRPAASAA